MGNSFTSPIATTTFSIASSPTRRPELSPHRPLQLRRKNPRNFVLDPTERWMLVANQDSNLISVFARNPRPACWPSKGRASRQLRRCAFCLLERGFRNPAHCGLPTLQKEKIARLAAASSTSGILNVCGSPRPCNLASCLFADQVRGM